MSKIIYLKRTAFMSKLVGKTVCVLNPQHLSWGPRAVVPENRAWCPASDGWSHVPGAGSPQLLAVIGSYTVPFHHTWPSRSWWLHVNSTCTNGQAALRSTRSSCSWGHSTGVTFPEQQNPQLSRERPTSRGIKTPKLLFLPAFTTNKQE